MVHVSEEHIGCRHKKTEADDKHRQQRSREHYAGELKDYNISEECQHDGEHRYFDEERHQGGCYRRQNEVFSRKCNLLDEPAVAEHAAHGGPDADGHVVSTEESRRG